MVGGGGEGKCLGNKTLNNFPLHTVNMRILIISENVRLNEQSFFPSLSPSRDRKKSARKISRRPRENRFQFSRGANLFFSTAYFFFFFLVSFRLRDGLSWERRTARSLNSQNVENGISEVPAKATFSAENTIPSLLPPPRPCPLSLS